MIEHAQRRASAPRSSALPQTRTPRDASVTRCGCAGCSQTENDERPPAARAATRGTESEGEGDETITVDGDSDAVPADAPTPAPAPGVTPPTPPPPQSCAVASGPSYAQTGTIPVTTSGGRKKARMDFTAKFTNDTAKFQAARCCEVHQFIKWDSVYHKANGGPPHSGFPSSAAADTWIEDRDKKDKRYGHRTDAHSDPGSGCFDEYKSGGARDQANGDEYCGNDSPGTSRPGQFQFQLKAVDVCKSNAEIASSSVVTIDW